MRSASTIASVLLLLTGGWQARADARPQGDDQDVEQASPEQAKPEQADEEGTSEEKIAQVFDEDAAETETPETDAEVSAGAGAKEQESGRLGSLHIGGYIQPTFGFRYRPNGVPRDRYDYSAAATTTGIEIGGEPVEHWSYTLHVEVTGRIFYAIRGDQPVDGNGSSDGGKGYFGAINPLSLATDAQSLTSAVQVEEVSIAYDPLDNLGFKLGQMRIPFTVEQQSPNTALMFPGRSAPNDVFLRGSDLGALGQYGVPLDRVGLDGGQAIMSAGVFNGSGVSETLDNEQGALYALRFDLNPLGSFPAGESYTKRGPLRIGVGAGLLYLPSTVYDDAGYQTMQARDLRASLSVRLAAGGFYFQGEALRRQRTDSLSARPLLATGAYGQGSYYVPIDEELGLAPIARLGWTERDEAFDPRTTVWTEAGATLYLRRKGTVADDVRLTLEYLGENRVTEGENAHGLVAQAQLLW